VAKVTKQDEFRHAELEDWMFEESRKRIGIEFTPPDWATNPYYNTQATRDTIRHFARGIGDDNPLFCDPDYAQKSRYGCLVAPPCFLYSVYWPAGFGVKIPGIHGWHSGNDWEWYRPMLENDEFTPTNILTDVVDRQSKMAGRTMVSYSDAYYRNQRGELVAKAKGWTYWGARQATKDQKKYTQLGGHKYTSEEIEAIERALENEEIRGADPRYWEDVEVGDELTPVVKGPLSPRDITAWCMGGGAPYMNAHGLELKYRRRHPAIGMKDSETGVVDVPVLVHMESTRAGEISVGGAYDFGSQRISWLGHLLTNWIGDDGFLKRLYAELRYINIVGDTTWIKGRVSGKYVDEPGQHLVEIECWGENQDGRITMPGRAAVVLPSKLHGPVTFFVKGEE